MLPQPSYQSFGQTTWRFSLFILLMILTSGGTSQAVAEDADKVPFWSTFSTDGFDPKKYVREWSDDTGNHRVTASLESEGPNGVTLVKRDLSRIIVPSQRLSTRDKLYLAMIDKENSKDRLYQLGYNAGYFEMRHSHGPVWRKWAVLILPLLALLCGIAILIQSFRESLLWGLGVLLIPCAYFIFVAVHWRDTGKYLVMQILFLAAAGFLASLEMPQTIQTFKESLEVQSEISAAMKAQGLGGA